MKSRGFRYACGCGLALWAASLAGCNEEMGNQIFGPGGTGASGLLNGGVNSFFVTQPGGFSDALTTGGANQVDSVFSPRFGGTTTGFPPTAFTGGTPAFTGGTTAFTGGSSVFTAPSTGMVTTTGGLATRTPGLTTGVRPALGGVSTVAGGLAPSTLTGGLTAGSPFASSAFNNVAGTGFGTLSPTSGLTTGTTGFSSAITGFGTSTFGSAGFNSSAFGTTPFSSSVLGP